MGRAVRVVTALLGLLAVTAAAALVWGWMQLHGSLPVLDGTRPLAGLSAPVRVTRDALGVPTVQGATRVDVARATGFLHAQDRFFQMDLSRRRAAGELAALVGPRAVPLDREIRIHRFRAVARRAVELLEGDGRALLDAYAAGVNAGLEALEAPPFEYLVLRQTPAPWRLEDTFLVVLSMFVTLQDSDGDYESTLATMDDVLPRSLFEFLAPLGSDWDAPLVGDPFDLPPIPGPDVYDLRSRKAHVHSRGPANPMPERSHDLPEADGGWAAWVRAGEWGGAYGSALGSNSFAVSGRLTRAGGALLANDMHLSVRVPNTWYRASLEWPAGAGRSHRVTGVTLPGVPAVVVGSNGHVAWGFTNTYADWSDLVLLEVDPGDPERYRTPGGWRQFERHAERIDVAGGEAGHLTVSWTIWGPLLGRDHRGRMRAYRWVAHSAERLAASITPFESARTLEEALDEANGVGAPGQNVVVAGADGRIGWSIYGAIPRRAGTDGRVPVSWADGTRGWNGWLDPREYPRVIEPPDGRIWTANARVVDGDMLAKLGDGSYEIGSRARIIRDRLFARGRFDAGDLLDIQLDTGADFLARWRDLLLSTLEPDAVREHPMRAALRDVVRDGWNGRADPDSAAYRLTRSFREEVFDRVTEFVLSECYEADPAFDYTTVRRRDAAIWRLASERPLHLLDPKYDSWGELLTDAADAVVEDAMDGRAGELRDRTWSEYNVASYRHPLSAAIPFAGRWLDMPATALPGDLFTPRVHWGAVAASERMVVSPGREAEGVMHMPTGQSGHPLSPFYANSHAPWLTGEATPFLPGPPVHTLTLTP